LQGERREGVEREDNMDPMRRLEAEAEAETCEGAVLDLTQLGRKSGQPCRATREEDLVLRDEW
jgi:hypothetical protein